MNKQAVVCPADHVVYDFPFERTALDPLLHFLYENQPLPAENMVFPVGTVTPDGRLDLCKQQLGVKGMQLVMDALQHNTSIRHLLAGTNAFGDPGAVAIATMIANNQTLETLYMGCNYITETGCRAISEALAQNRSVKSVWLKRNPIGQSAKALIQLLQTNPQIRTLDLVNTCMGEDLTALLQYLQQNITLERLYLSGNYLAADMMQPVSDLLTANRTLKALFLSVNNIGDAGAEILARGLAVNTTLEELSLASCGIGLKGMQAVMKALAGNKQIKSIDLGYAPSTRALGAKANSQLSAQPVADLIANTHGLQYINLVKTGLGAADKQQLLQSRDNNTTVNIVLDGHEATGFYNTHPDSRAIKSVYR